MDPPHVGPSSSTRAASSSRRPWRRTPGGRRPGAAAGTTRTARDTTRPFACRGRRAADGDSSTKTRSTGCRDTGTGGARRTPPRTAGRGSGRRAALRVRSTATSTAPHPVITVRWRFRWTTGRRPRTAINTPSPAAKRYSVFRCSTFGDKIHWGSLLKHRQKPCPVTRVVFRGKRLSSER